MEKNIKDLLDNFKEEPSARCWDSIEQQLELLNSASSANDGGSSATSGAKSSLVQKSGTFFGKAAAIAVSTAAIATIAVATIIIISKKDQNITGAIEPEPDSTSIIYEDTLLSQEEETSLLITTAISKESQPVGIPTDAVSENIIISEPVSDTVLPMNAGNHLSVSEPAKITPTSTNSKASVQLKPTQKPSGHSQPYKPESKESDDSKVVTNHHPSPVTPVLSKLSSSAEPMDEAKNFSLRIPNIFTPNGDGINDYFEIEGLEDCQNVALIIRNRNGNVIFQSKRYENNWDGGQWEDGLYFYFITCTVDGKDHVKNGTVTIKRTP